MISYLQGMLHIQEQINTKTFAENFDLPFMEAILYLRDRVSLSPEEFYKLDAKARFKAFTVSKLTGLDAIERVKQKLIESTSSKEDFVQNVGRDEILKKVGFHRENPFYLETVYRTNITAAYNAGRWAQIKRNKDIIKYLRYIAIDDERTTPICRALNGTTLPADDPFWKKYTPPLHFNCYSEDTEVLTKEGWKLFKDVNGNESFVSINPETHEIEYVPAIRKIAYPYKGKMIHLKARNFDLLVTPDHNMAYISSWKYKDRKKKGEIPKIELREAKTLADSDVIPRTGKWKGVERESIKIGDLVFDTYYFMKFMGWYLSEGSITKKSKNYWHIKISQEKENYIPEILEICTVLFEPYFKIYRWAGGVFIAGTNKHFFTYLKNLGRSYEKYIPEELKQLSPKYLRAFLDSFCKGDGTEYNLKEINKKKEGKWDANFKNLKLYFTSSKRLADDITELILKCGKLPSITPPSSEKKTIQFRNGKYTIKHNTWKIFELNSKNFYVRKKDRRGEQGQLQNYFEVDYEGYVYCVELEKNHILYVRRNGRCTWSGNCRSSIMPITKYQKEYRKKNPPKKIPETDKSFLANPFESWWTITDSMARRIVEYGITEEVLREAKKLCDRQFADEECSEYKEVENLLSEIEDVEKKKKAIEEEFIKKLQTFDVKNPISSFKGLFVSEKAYREHVNKRLDEKVIKDETDYLRKTLYTLAYPTSAYYENYSKSWDRILYDSKRKWMVVLTEGGYILSSMPVTKKLRELFEDHFKKAKISNQTLKIQRVSPNEKLKKEVRRIFKKL